MTQVSRQSAGVLAALALAACAGDPAVSGNRGAAVETADVARFYRLYDAYEGEPPADVLDAEYLSKGSDGLKTLARLRDVTGARIHTALVERPGLYEDARACAEQLPAARARIAEALSRLAAILPDADFPPVTIAVGRGRPVGVGGPETGIQIGLEALCAADFLNPDLEDRFVYVIVHEYVHVQQSPEFTEQEGKTVLEASLEEGIAEFVTEQIAGDVAYSHLAPLVEGREGEIERAFLADMDKTDLSDWLFNTGDAELADLGYWAGYRIAAAYYEQAGEKDQAIRDMLALTDAKAFLEESGWQPEGQGRE